MSRDFLRKSIKIKRDKRLMPRTDRVSRAERRLNAITEVLAGRSVLDVAFDYDMCMGYLYDCLAQYKKEQSTT